MDARSLSDGLWRIALRAAYPPYVAWCAVVRPRIRGAYVLAWWDGRLLVVRHSYKRGLSVPAGLLRPDESPAAGALRELREEVGLELPDSAIRAAFDFTTSREFARDHVHVFEVDLDAEPRVAVDRREIVWADFLTLDEVRRQRLRPVFQEVLERLLARRA